MFVDRPPFRPMLAGRPGLRSAAAGRYIVRQRTQGRGEVKMLRKAGLALLLIALLLVVLRFTSC
ncbi:MAG: hypothetical protein ACYS8K_02505 [Planctomycetota bacterium]